MKKTCIPLVYACSGCPSVGQLANHMAVLLDCDGLAEMSCTSGVGGGVTVPTRIARSGRPILALDGCALGCAKACLARAEVSPSVHLVLDQLYTREPVPADTSTVRSSRVWQTIVQVATMLSRDEPADAAAAH